MASTATITVALTEVETVKAALIAAARVRHATEQGNGIMRYEAWAELCRALDALGIRVTQ